MSQGLTSVCGPDEKSYVFYVKNNFICQKVQQEKTEEMNANNAAPYIDTFIQINGANVVSTGVDLAAVSYNFGGVDSIRLFFQDKDKKLAELGKDGKDGKWALGFLGNLAEPPNTGSGMTAHISTVGKDRFMKVYIYSKTQIVEQGKTKDGPVAIKLAQTLIGSLTDQTKGEHWTIKDHLS